MLPPHEEIYLNDLYTGRLVETPEQMAGVINTFLAQDGQLNAVATAGTVLVTESTSSTILRRRSRGSTRGFRIRSRPTA